MKKIFIIILSFTLFMSCYTTPTSGELRINFDPSPDGLSLIPGGDGRDYYIKINDIEYELYNSFFVLDDIGFGEYTIIATAYNQDGNLAAIVETIIIIDDYYNSFDLKLRLI